jgi:hypothetical protein
MDLGAVGWGGRGLARSDSGEGQVGQAVVNAVMHLRVP